MRFFAICGVVLCAGGIASSVANGQSLSQAVRTDTVLAQPLTAQRTFGPEDFQRVALERNADLLAVRQDIAAARGFLTQSRLRPNPGLDVTVSNGRPVGSPGERSFDVGYAHTIELGGKRARRIDVAQVGVEIAEFLVADRERLLRADVQTRYAEALAAARNVATLGELYELNDRSLRVAAQRVAEGEGAPLERTLLQVEVGRIAADRAIAAGHAARAFATLKLVSGFSPDDPIGLPGELTTAGVDVSLEQAIERGLLLRTDLKAARAEEARADAELRLTGAERVPDVIGLVRYGQSSTRLQQFGTNAVGQVVPLHDTDRTLTLGVSIPLPFASRNQGTIESARARRQAAALRREFVEQTVRTDVRAAYAQYVGARQAVGAFDQLVIKQVQEAVNTIRTSYELGETPLLDLVQEQRRLVETQKAFTEVVKELYIARATLEAAVGGELR